MAKRLKVPLQKIKDIWCKECETNTKGKRGTMCGICSLYAVMEIYKKVNNKGIPLEEAVKEARHNADSSLRQMNAKHDERYEVYIRNGKQKSSGEVGG